MKLRGVKAERMFKWIGRGLNRRARDRRRENLRHYSAFKYGDIEGKIGDYVLVSNFDAADPESLEGCDIAKILELYELGDAEVSYRAVVQWYSRPHQLPKKFTTHQMSFPQLNNEFEVLEDKRNFDNDVSIETFFAKCQVVQAMPEEEPEEIVSLYGGKNFPVFIVRFQFWSQRGKERFEMLPMSPEECGDAVSECDSVVEDAKEGKKPRDSKKQSHRSGGRKNEEYGNGNDSVDRSNSPEITSTGEPSLRYILLSGGSERKRRGASSQKDAAKKGRQNERDGVTSPRSSSVGRSLASPTAAANKASEGGRRELRERDISGLLEEEEDGEEVQSEYTSSVLSPSRLKLKRVVESPLAKVIPPGTPKRKLTHSKTKDSPCSELSGTTGALDSPVVGHRAAATSSAGGRVRTPTHSAGVKSKTPRTPSSHTRMTPGSLKGISARKRLQLLSEVGLSGGVGGMAERTSDVGPLATPLSPLDEARARLHVSATPKCLPCRDAEFASIYSFIEDKILDGVGGCMYVCGVPGTGKTATVHMAVERLQEESHKGLVPEFEFAEINGMRVTEPRRAYSQLLKALTGRAGVAPEEARDSLEQRFSRPAPRRLPTLLLVDELDLLCTRRQDVVYNLMDWPSRAHSRLVVITIANTMDLPERVLMSKVCSRMGLTRLTFHPYTFQQLQEIVMSRMQGLKAFDPDAVQLVARKVAAVSGDARRALDICRRATECAESELLVEKKKNQSPAARRKSTKAMKGVLVTMQHVDQAVSEMISTSKAKAIQSCSEMEKLFLQSVASEVERTGMEEAGFERVHSVFRTLCTYNGYRQPTVSDSMGICWRLGSLRLVLTEASSRADILQRVMLNVDVDSVHYALKMDRNQ